MTVALNGLDLALETPKSVTYIMDRSQTSLLSFHNDFSSRSFVLSLCFYFVFLFVFFIFPLLLLAPPLVREFYSCKSLNVYFPEELCDSEQHESQLPECSGLC